MLQSFNPEQTASDIRSKSFLKTRFEQRDTMGSAFFKDNKIRSCSYVKEASGGLKAVPFYDKRDNTLYPTPSAVLKSWNSDVHSLRQSLYAGIGNTKPLQKYNPKSARSSIYIPDFRPPYPNSSQIEIGDRNKRDVKHYVTTYSNSFLPKSKNLPTIHPGIEASRNKWTRSRLAK